MISEISIVQYYDLSFKCKIFAIWLVETAYNISNIFSCCRVNINGMWSARKQAGYTKKNHLYYNLKHTCVGAG